MKPCSSHVVLSSSFRLSFVSETSDDDWESLENEEQEMVSVSSRGSEEGTMSDILSRRGGRPAPLLRLNP
jgi:hypothetical protein